MIPKYAKPSITHSSIHHNSLLPPFASISFYIILRSNTIPQQFSRLAAILAPTVTLDYSDAFAQPLLTMSRTAFLALSSSPDRLGGIVDCIHHIGGSKYDRTGPDSVTGYHQVRTEYKRFKTLEKKEVEATGQGLTLMEHYYKKIDGEWKLAGMKPGGRMNEFNFDRIFVERKGKGKEGAKL